MGIQYLTLSELNTNIVLSYYTLSTQTCVYNKYNNEESSINPGEIVIIINKIIGTPLPVYNILLPPTTPGMVVTIKCKLNNIGISIKNSIGDPITLLNGNDLCKIVQGSPDSWGVLFNQSSNQSLDNGYLYGNVRIVDLPTKPGGILPIDPTESSLSSKVLTYTLSTNGTFIITNPNIAFTGTIQLEFSPDIQGFSASESDQIFTWIIATNPPSLASTNIKKAILQNTYGYTNGSMLAIIDMERIVSISISIDRTAFQTNVILGPSDLVVTTLPIALKEVVNPEGPITYKSIVPLMTSNTSPIPFIISATSEFTPAWHAFNPTQPGGWRADTIDSGDVPDIAVQMSSDTNVSKTVNLITLNTLDLTPDQMNIQMYVYGDYYKNGLRFTELIATINNFIANDDGTSAEYKLYLTGTYNMLTFYINSFTSDSTLKPGIKNIQLYTNSDIVADVGGYSTCLMPSTVSSTDSGLFTIPTEYNIPDISGRCKYYFNTIATNLFSYDYNTNSIFNVLNTINGSNQIKYLCYNGPDTLNKLELYDYNMIIGQHRCVYRGLQTKSYTSSFRLAPTKLQYTGVDVIPFALDTPASSSDLTITLAQNSEICVFTNNTNREIIVDCYLPMCFKPIGTTPPTIALFVNLVSQPFKLRATPFDGQPSTSMLTNLYDTFTVQPKSLTTMQVVIDIGTIELQFLDPNYYVGVFTIY